MGEAALHRRQVEAGEENDVFDPAVDQRCHLPFQQGLAADVEEGLGFLFGEREQALALPGADNQRSEEHTSELQSLMRISYAVFCLKKKNNIKNLNNTADDSIK